MPVPDAGEMDQIDLEFDKERAIEQNFTPDNGNKRRPDITDGTLMGCDEPEGGNRPQAIEADVEARYKFLEQARADYMNKAAGELELARTGPRQPERNTAWA